MVQCPAIGLGTYIMPIAKNVFLWGTASLLAVGMAILVAIVATSWWLVERTSAFYEEELQAVATRVSTVEVRKALQDMEIGQRGFLLTNDEAYLAPFVSASAVILPAYERLVELARPYPRMAEAMPQLGEGIRHKIAELEETIALARTGQMDEAIEIVRTDRGKALMDQSRGALEEILAAADRRIRDGVAAQSRNLAWLRWVSIGGGLVIVLLAGAAVWLAMRYTRELVDARGELEVLNTELEERVEERTQDLIRANEEIQRFAYIVTHDLRAPLVNIMGFTSELDQTMKVIQAYVLADGKALGEAEIHDARLAATEDLPEAIGFIRSSTRKMDGLINAILKISREGQRQLKSERIVLAEIIEGAANAIHHQIVENGGQVRIDAAVAPIISDRLSLEQAIGNLLDNAVKYHAPERRSRSTSAPAAKGSSESVSTSPTMAAASARKTTSACSTCSGAPARRTGQAKA